MFFGQLGKQGNFSFYGFNYSGYTNGKVRWGFAWNNEANQQSNDVSGGIGMHTNFGYYSAGDKKRCCQTSTGINRKARVEIYNRWGQQLFSSQGYSSPWDGTYNNELVPDGTYYYVIDLNDPNEPEPFKGAILVLKSINN